MALPIGTEFVSGMKLKVRYEDAIRVSHESVIELDTIVKLSIAGYNTWIDTTEAYWTEDFLLANATLIEEGHPVGMCSNEQREVASKNFDEIKVGSWYKKRDGDVIKLSNQQIINHTWYKEGNYYFSREESPNDLVLEILEPVLVPVKRKVKKEIVGAALVFPSGVVSHYSSLEDAEASIARSNPNKFTVVKLTGTYETEE